MSFSVVIPVKDEAALMLQTLPSWFSLGAEEVIVCTDMPCPSLVKDALNKFLKYQYNGRNLRHIEVRRNPDYVFHQAWVRRLGFQVAKNHRILTGDIDLEVNRESCLKALSVLGNGNGVGLCSVSKRYVANTIPRVWRNIMYTIILPVYPSRFTGLYAFWRPYWLETEDGGIMSLENPVHRMGPNVCTGEDTYLKNCMETKYRCLFLRDIGGRSLRSETEDQRRVQFENGRYHAARKRSVFKALATSFLYFRPYLLSGYLHERWGRA